MVLHGMVLNWAQGRVPFIIPMSEFEMRDRSSYSCRLLIMPKPKNQQIGIDNPSLHALLLQYVCVSPTVCCQCLNSDCYRNSKTISSYKKQVSDSMIHR
jgi:hypothetical protein